MENISDFNIYENVSENIYFLKYLRQQKYFDFSVLYQIFKIQELNNKIFGDIVLELNILNSDTIASIYDEAIKENKHFSEIALKKNLLDQDQINTILKKQQTNYLSADEVLLSLGVLHPNDLEKELKIYKENQQKNKDIIESKIKEIKIPFIQECLDGTILTISRVLLMKPKLTTMIQKVKFIYKMDGLYKISLTDEKKKFKLTLFFNYDSKSINEIFIYKFKTIKKKKFLKLRDEIPKEVTNIIAGVIIKYIMKNFSDYDLIMSVPENIKETDKIVLPVESYKFSILTPLGKIEMIIFEDKL